MTDARFEVANPYCCQELCCLCNEPQGLSCLFCAPCGLWTYASGANWWTGNGLYACPGCKSDLCDNCCMCMSCPTIKKCLYLASLCIPFIGCCRIAMQHKDIIDWVSSKQNISEFGKGCEALPGPFEDRSRHQPLLIGFFCCPCVLPWHISVFTEAHYQATSELELVNVPKPNNKGRKNSIDDEIFEEAETPEIACGLCGFPSWHDEGGGCCPILIYRGIRSYPFGFTSQLELLGPQIIHTTHQQGKPVSPGALGKADSSIP